VFSKNTISHKQSLRLYSRRWYSPAGRYHSLPTLLLDVPGQVAAFWEIKKNLFLI